MPYFAIKDAVDARRLVSDESVVINGTIQSASKGDWVVRRGDGRTVIWNDEYFRKSFVKLPD